MQVEPRICPDDRDGYPWPTIGTTFDYQLRFLLGEEHPESLVAYLGAQVLAAHWR
jgi:hypothetical protein